MLVFIKKNKSLKSIHSMKIFEDYFETFQEEIDDVEDLFKDIGEIELSKIL